MSDLKADILDRLVAKYYHTPHDMSHNVELKDPVTDERYFFKYDHRGMNSVLAIRQAQADLSHQWSPQ